MGKITDKQIDELRRIAAKLTQLLSAFDLDALEIPAEIQQRVASLQKRGICLACELPIEETDRARRGLDSACYATTMARIRRGDTTEVDEILAGRLASDKKRAGRKAKMDRLTESEDAKLSASDKKPRKK